MKQATKKQTKHKKYERFVKTLTSWRKYVCMYVPKINTFDDKATKLVLYAPLDMDNHVKASYPLQFGQINICLWTRQRMLD